MVFFALPCPSRTEQGALRIAMPYPSAEELAFKLPVLVRMPKQHDRKYVPRALQGAELERNRTYDDILPLSILPSAEAAAAGRALAYEAEAPARTTAPLLRGLSLRLFRRAGERDPVPNSPASAPAALG